MKKLLIALWIAGAAFMCFNIYIYFEQRRLQVERIETWHKYDVDNWNKARLYEAIQREDQRHYKSGCLPTP